MNGNYLGGYFVTSPFSSIGKEQEFKSSLRKLESGNLYYNPYLKNIHREPKNKVLSD